MKTFRTLLGCICLLSTSLHAQVPQIINYQGRVAVGTVNFDGSGAFKFALVDAAGTTTYWSNDGTSTAGSQPTAAVSLTVTMGLYSVLLGDTTLAGMTAIPNSVFANADVRLRVWFNDGTNGSQLLTPDQRLAAVGYAMVAGSVPDGSITSAKIATGAVTNTQLATNAVQAAHIADGAVGSTQIANGSIATGNLANSSVTAAKLGSNVGLWSVNAANVFRSGGNVGIGTTTPGFPLNFADTLGDKISLFFDSGNSYGFGVQFQLLQIHTDSASGDIAFGYGSSAAFTETMRIKGTGDVGIGAPNPSTKLEVAGTVTATAFSGNGAGLTNIPASAVATAPPGMALIPAGSFTMGNSIGDADITDATPIKATVSAFYVDVNLVSLSLWQSVYNYATANGYTFVRAGAGKGATHPVQTVDWYDCVKWCNARSEQAGRRPVYYTDAGLTTVYKTGEPATVYVDWVVSGYRLPTEAEWEKAARGGRSNQRFPWGNTISKSQANYNGDTSSYAYDLGPNGYHATYATGGFPDTSPVGSFAANGYGLNDMAGNVFEWCWDWYGTPYAGGSDPYGPATGSFRVLRGGTWFDFAYFARCANRIRYFPTNADSRIGFRAVLPPGQP